MFPLLQSHSPRWEALTLSECSAALVKEWCEGQSVCCLWRENSRGRARKR